MNANPNPTCKNNCLFSQTNMSITTLHSSPLYDKNGNMYTHLDPNIISYEINCATCAKKWQASTKNGETTFCEK